MFHIIHITVIITTITVSGFGMCVSGLQMRLLPCLREPNLLLDA